MNVHDQRRRDQLAKTLSKAKEQAETCFLYLVTNERPFEEISDAELALEHIKIALGHLGLAVEV